MERRHELLLSAKPYEASAETVCKNLTGLKHFAMQGAAASSYNVRLAEMTWEDRISAHLEPA